MKITISGSSGFLGGALMNRLAAEGYKFSRLVRGAADGKITYHWEPAAGKIDVSALKGSDAVVNLSGENLASGRWTFRKKKRIADSRVFSTGLLANTIAGLKDGPKVMINASAVGYYGTGGEEWIDESTPAGDGFLAEVCKKWEAAAEPAREAGIRVVHLRFGVILGREGGALKKLLVPFRFGLGGKVGSGKQYMSWISIDDAVGIIGFAVQNAQLRGPVNAVAPEPVTNKRFTEALARTLRRPARLPLPALPLKAVLGEMAEATLLSGARVRPQQLVEKGYQFQHSNIDAALHELLK